MWRDLLLCLVVVLVGTTIAADKVYDERNGYIVFECESATPEKPWVKKSDSSPAAYADFTGTGWMFQGGSNNLNGSPNGLLKYKFKINQAGTYWVYIRGVKGNAANQPGCEWDDCNDVWFRIPGVHGNFTKFLINHAYKTWGWWDTMDKGSHNFQKAKFNFDAGEYEMQIGDRSKHVAIDRIVIWSGAFTSKDVATDLGNPESPGVGEPDPVGADSRLSIRFEKQSRSASLGHYTIRGEKLSSPTMRRGVLVRISRGSQARLSPTVR